MKILHVITSLYTGGAEKLIVDLLPRFREMGNEVELLLFDGTETPFYHELSNVGITIHHLSIGGNVYNPLNILRLKKFLKQYDIIHTHNTACQYYIALAKSLSHSVCHLVTTEHNTTNRRRGIPFFKHIDRFIYNQYERIIAIAPSTADNLKNFVVTCPKIEVIYNGIDISKYNTNPPAAITTEMEIVITMIAAFRPQKNQDALIKAMTLLPDNYKLWLVGDGERHDRLTELVSRLNLKSRVEFLGVRSDIPAIMEKSHIIVLSSHWEGFGLAAVEGCASSRPVIASDVQGLREVIGGAGILFPDNDHHALANEILRLANNPTLYHEVVERCQQRAANYDINIMAHRYNDVYISLMK